MSVKPNHSSQNEVSLLFFVTKKIASHTNGNAVPSFIPPSAVRANFARLRSFSLGGPTCTSEARTGSVGASTAPNKIADATSICIQYQAANAVKAMHDNIPKLTRRKGTRHLFNENGS